MIAYEALCCLVLQLLGAQRYHLTPAGDEGGIDFLATVHFFSKSHIFSGLGREVKIVGQSKMYAERVPVGNVDAFITTLENVRKGSDRVRDIIPAWFHDSSGPIIGWIVGHKGFQSGAQNEAKKHGIILSTSRDLAEIISLSSRFYCDEVVLDRVVRIFSEVRILLEEFP